MKKIVLLLVLVFSFSGCEKDDICDASTSTTPRLVVEFYDNALLLPTTKAVTNLKAVANGMTDGVVFNSTLATSDPSRYLSNDKKIFLPLRMGETDNSTTYALTLNSGVVGSENTDYVTFTYNKHNVYVSRACGYKTLFDLTNTNSNILTPDSDNWIKDISIYKANLESENEVHIKIKF
ncbi:DUF6452 family protein [Flavobacterium aciduliphilum]|uniref:Uncharacterized protein n=1 Tax=Flavobacterium aciduliphilum TaxID=1101402 RepID=A0A328YPK5_9FLAO|nr:DUF6452 family protein [Flavobacterium aciduliphilum]RAR75520.1 hypothetical protein CLV55_101220 [Flavobacterium aciduliphilum]